MSLHFCGFTKKRIKSQNVTLENKNEQLFLFLLVFYLNFFSIALQIYCPLTVRATRK
jgi:hypothetical protein